jgi:hypothetical protein
MNNEAEGDLLRVRDGFGRPLTFRPVNWYRCFACHSHIMEDVLLPGGKKISSKMKEKVTNYLSISAARLNALYAPLPNPSH